MNRSGLGPAAFCHDKHGGLALASTATLQRTVLLFFWRFGGEETLVNLHVSMKRDSHYYLKGGMEVDEGFFSTETPEEQKNSPLKRGRGSQRKTSVLVMAESSRPKTTTVQEAL